MACIVSLDVDEVVEYARGLGVELGEKQTREAIELVREMLSKADLFWEVFWEVLGLAIKKAASLDK